MLLETINTWRAQRIIKRSRYSRQLEDLPANLYEYWKSSAKNEFDGIPTDAVFFARAAEGLLNFFDCVATSRKPCALPSKAADSVWHAWQRLTPIRLEIFCRRHYGRDIPHVEKAAMTGNMDDALAACLVRARELDNMRPEGPRLPALFLLDRKLKMPYGFGYMLTHGRPGYGELDERGRLDPLLACPPALEVAGLLAAGYISRDAYDEYMERAARRNSGGSCGSGCGTSVGVSGSDCGGGDSGGDGGGGDGGSSCGSSCGGGCGGGD